MGDSGVVTTSTRRRQGWVALAVAVVCALTALQLATRREDERTLRQANEAGSAGRYEEAARLAAGLRDGTTEADARVVEAGAAFARSRFTEARTALLEAVRLRPNDWQARRDLAAVLLQLGDRRAAREQYGQALALNPRMRPLPAFAAASRTTGSR